MAMEAIGNIGAVGTTQIPDVQKAERVVNFPEGAGQGQEKPDFSLETPPTQASAPKPEPQESNNPNVPTRQERTQEQIEAENKRIMNAISEMNKKMFNNSEAVFGIHEDTNRITIKIVDKTTRETIKELPPEKTLDMIAKAWELAGLMVDEKG
ncbi:flagellar protein FlaG [Butyrivibrio sp. INlla16]|uniref:flagellar protein FlaG n=1 Tax=Butyrivibrio sp. INlla16 TaxID=1520807 RepID=UPI00088DAFD2|nr:flagellar protein FlaG [Butyrivibrio sp. INlla16]SDB68915.1 flagellar protein FlaG [Butyrivibrio sp. INlla16]